MKIPKNVLIFSYFTLTMKYRYGPQKLQLMFQLLEIKAKEWTTSFQIRVIKYTKHFDNFWSSYTYLY